MVNNLQIERNKDTDRRKRIKATIERFIDMTAGSK